MISFLQATVGIGLACNKSKDATLTLTYDPTLENSSFASIASNSFKFPARSKYSFAWNAGLGLSYKLRDNAIIDIIQYNRQSIGNFETEKGQSMINSKLFIDEEMTIKAKLVSHTISTGIRIFF